MEVFSNILLLIMAIWYGIDARKAAKEGRTLVFILELFWLSFCLYALSK